MDMEPRPAPRLPAPTDEQRKAAAVALQDAVGHGRLTLAEFEARVGAVWRAEQVAEIEAATAGLGAAPVLDSTRPVGTVVAVLGDQRRVGRWRLPRRLRTISLLGDVHLDLCSVVCAEDEVEIRAYGVLGDLKIKVPDGVEVELTGLDLLGDRELRLAPVPRVPGTPLVRVKAFTLFGDVTVRSATAGDSAPGWRRWLLGQPSPPVPGNPPPSPGDAGR
jgi:hypothetical protein